ncbi:MAG: universal stress protein [Balneolales bacterium]
MKNPKILVAVDFSDLSTHALKAAHIFAQRFNGTITPFHAYIPVTDLDSFHYVGSGASPHEKYGDIEKMLSQRLRDTAMFYLSEEYLNDPILDVGNAARAITYNAKDFDLVIMGTHGRTGFSRFLMGSVTEKVLRMCNKPMITVTSSSDLDKFSSLLVTTDMSENSFHAFPYANSIAEITKSKIDLVHVVSNEQYFDARAADQTARERELELEKLAEKYFGNIRQQVTPQVIIGNKAPHEEIQKLARDKKYNLLVISSVGRTGLDYLMMGSTASHVVRSVRNAVFIINPRGISDDKARELHYQNQKNS